MELMNQSSSNAIASTSKSSDNGAGKSRNSHTSAASPPDSGLKDGNLKGNGNSFTLYEALPSFKDVPNVEKQHLFMKKHSLFCVVFDFGDLTKYVKSVRHCMSLWIMWLLLMESSAKQLFKKWLRHQNRNSINRREVMDFLTCMGIKFRQSWSLKLEMHSRDSGRDREIRDETANDMSVLQGISIVLDRNPELRQEGMAYEFLQWYICRMEALFVVDANLISLKCWDQDECLSGGHGLMVQGYEPVIRTLAKDIDIRLNHRVTKVSRTSNNSRS